MKNPARTSAHSVFPPIDYSRNAEVLAHPARRLTTALMTAGLVIGLLAAISTTRAAHALPLKPLMDSFSEATLRGQSTAGNPSMTAVSGKNVKTQPWASRPLYGGTTLTVTNNGDDGTPGAGTLREALDFQANSCYMGPIAIHFAIPTGGPASDYVITPASPLPPITCSNTTIDGYTQSGATANTLATGSDANIAITLDGAALAGSSPGLTLNADYLAVRGLIVYNFTVYPGIEIVGGTGASITGNSIVGNGFGVKMMGGEGVYIGGSLPSERNTISSNDAGILLGSASGQTGSQIINNYIGTAASGSGGAPNGSNNAIEVYIPDTIIANNLIAYNLGAGIGMLEGPAYIHDNNIFANLQGGVRVYANECAPQGVSIRANNIGFPNGGGQGIALGDVLQGDARDDNGLLNSPNCYHANGGQPGSPAFAQNYPVITAVNYAWNGASVVTTIDAVLDSAADTTYDIDLFDNTYTVDTANIGIGAKYLLTVPSTTDGSGHTAIQMIASGTPVYYPSMTASTPFGPTGGTSEFSVQGLTSLIYTSAPYTSYSIAAGGTQSQTFTFRNDDAQPISVPVPTFNQPEFSVTSPPCGMVAPGATCSVVVAFGTATAGTVGGTMTIGPVSSASAAVAPVTSQPVQSFIFALTGTATAGTPAASIAGTGTFPNVTVGGASAVQTVTITNSGSANLLLNTLTVSVSGIFVDTTSGAPPNAAHWCGFGSTASGDPLTAPPITLAPGASCALNLIFKPSAAISYSATLTINTNATPSSSTFALSGTGIAAAPPTMAVSFNPTSVVVGGTSTMTITLANSAASKADVNGTSSVTIPANLNFAGIGTNTCVATPNQAGQVFSFTNGTVPPMGTCTFDVPVQSAVPGTYTINIGPGQLFTTQGNNTNSSSNALTVTSTPTPGVTLSPPSVAFGARTVNTTSPPSTVTLSNSGGAPLTISSITSSGDFAVVSSCPLGPSTLGVGLNTLPSSAAVR